MKQLPGELAWTLGETNCTTVRDLKANCVEEVGRQEFLKYLIMAWLINWLYNRSKLKTDNLSFNRTHRTGDRIPYRTGDRTCYKTG